MILRSAGKRARPNRRAVIVGPYRVHNFGDDLIGAIIAKHLQRQGYEVTIPRLAPANADWLGTCVAENYDAQFETADLIVVGGGGIMSDTAGAKPGASYLKIVSQASAAGQLEGKRVVVTGVGAGPWLRDESRVLAVEVAHLADGVGVRDEQSSAHLATIGVDPAKITTGADIALLASEYLQFRSQRRRRVGLQFDIAQFADVHDNPAVPAISEAFARYAQAHARDVVLVSNGRHRSQLADAAPACRLLRYEDLKAFLPRLSGLRTILTSHLHLAITAYSQRIPPFSLYVREKTKRFYDQIGRPERAIDLRSATVADLDRLLAAAEQAEWSDEDETTLLRLQAQSRSLLEILH